jgi:hypothetical protein
VAENLNCTRIVATVEHVFHHVNVGSCRDGDAEIRGQKRAPFRESLGFKAGSCLIDCIFTIHQHSAKVRKGFKNRDEQRAAAAPKVGDGVVLREIPSARDRHVIFRGRCAHDGAEDGVRVRVLGPERYDTFALHDAERAFSGADALGHVGPTVGEQVGPEYNRGPFGIGSVLAQRLAEWR